MRAPPLPTALLLLLLHLVPVTGAAAQEARGPGLGSVAGAVLGGAAGLLGGGLIGGWATSRDAEPGNPDDALGESFPGFVWGAGAGITLGVPLGAHLGNGRRGDVGRSLLVSAGLFAAEVLVLSQLVDDGRSRHQEAAVAVAIGVPVLQILASVLIEGRTDGR